MTVKVCAYLFIFFTAYCQKTYAALPEQKNSCGQHQEALGGFSSSCGGQQVLPELPSSMTEPVLLVSSPSAAAIAGKSQKKENKPEVVQDWSDIFGGFPEGGTHVIRDSETWKNVWVRLKEGESPQVDFSKQMVVAAFLGMKPTGGYDVRVIKIEKSKSKWVIHVKQTKPPKGAFTIQALTSPYHIKLIDRTDLPVEFKILK